MKNLSTIALAAFLVGAAGASAQQSILVPWNQSWRFMHPMGTFPDVPPGGDADFETTWILPEGEFATQYNGPTFGATPRQTGVPAQLDSFDSGVSEAPIGYETMNYFASMGAEFTGFGDDDGDPGNGRSGLLQQPASAQRRAAYFRTTFAVPPGNPLVQAKIRYLIDDGAYIYLDGELVAVINMAATTPVNRDQYSAAPQVNAANATATEDALRLLDLALPDGSATGGVPDDAAVALNARVVRQVLSLAPGEHTLAVSVRSNSQTSSDLAMAIELSAEEGCLIQATASNVTRSNAGTPFNPIDDTFSFQIDASGVNTGATWTSDAPGFPGGGFGVPVLVGPFPIALSPLTVTLTAASDPGCTTQVTATAPGAAISAAATSFVRDNRGTVSLADDTFTAMVEVASQFASSGWVTTGTTPLAQSPGTPGSGTYGVGKLFGPYAVSAGPVTVGFADSVSPGVTTQLVLGTPVLLGGKSINGVLTDMLTAAPLPAAWVSNNAVPPTITMGTSGGDVWSEFRSEVVDLTAAGATSLTAELVARETSAGSNFELVDAFRAKLIVTGTGGTTEISLIAPYDTDGNGMINGVDAPYDANFDEFNLRRQPVTASLSNVFRLEARLPASAQSVQLVVEGKGVASSEFFDVRSITLSDRCTFTAAAAGIRRNTNGQPGNPAAHTVEFTLRATPTGLVSPLGWNVAFTRGGVPATGTGVTGGAYNVDVPVTGLAAEGAPIVATITDRSDPLCTGTVFIVVPGPPILVGSVNLGGTVSNLYSDGPVTGWTPAVGGLDMFQATAVSDFMTEAVDLSGVVGPVDFSMNLRAVDTSTATNFEAADVFLAELLLDDGTAVTTLNLTTPFDRAGDGQMNGAAAVDLDDFNPLDQVIGDSLDNLFPFSVVVPEGMVSVRLRLRARVDASSEMLFLRDVLISGDGTDPDGDRDGDGVSDADEMIAGTDPDNAASVFKVTAFAATSPGSFNAGFPTVNGRFYKGYVSTNLVTWTRDDTIAAVSGNGSPAAWPFTPVPQPGARTRYLRIAVAASVNDFPATLP